MSSDQLDLFVLTADIDQESTFNGLLKRYQALGTRRFTFLVDRDPGRDSGCRTNGVGILRTKLRQYSHALLVFDKHGSGRDNDSASNLEHELDTELAKNGWDDRARCIVIDPEVEVWAWSDSTALDEILGRRNLREWLVQQGLLRPGETKPRDPKHAMISAHGKRPKADIFRQLATRISFQNCTDRAFNRLLTTLQTWFPATPPEGPS